MRYCGTKHIWLCATLACAANPPRAQTATESVAEEPRALTPDEWEQLDTYIRQKVRVVSASCYDPALNQLQDRKFFGNVTVNIHIASGGRATAVETKETTLPSDAPYQAANARVQACLTDLIKSWTFPITHSDAHFLYSFHFEPQY